MEETYRLEKDTYVEGEETVVSEELTADLKTALQDL